MKKVKVKTTYFEMFEDPGLELPSINEDIRIERYFATVAEYRKLFSDVGKEWMWSSRLIISEKELENIITDSKVEIFLFKVDGKTAGYTELDRRSGNDIELAFLGLMPGFIGKGLGKYLLLWAIQKAWSYNPARLWLHTCTNDHPNALELYKNVGFKIYKVDMVEEYILDKSDYE